MEHQTTLGRALIDSVHPPRNRQDDAEVTKAVRKHAQTIGCDASNVQASIAWALRSSSHTLQAIREGRGRAQQLRGRQTVSVA